MNGRKAKRIANNLPVAPSYVGPKTFPNYPNVAGGAFATCRAAARCSPASVTIRSSWTSARLRRREPPRGDGQRGRGQGRPVRFSTHAIVLQVPSRRSPRTARACPDRTRRTPWSACGRRPSASASKSRTRTSTRTRGRRASGSRSRAWASRWSTRSSSRPVTGQVQPDPPAQRCRELRQVRGRAGAGEDPERPVRHRRTETDRTDIVQALLQGLPG